MNSKSLFTLVSLSNNTTNRPIMCLTAWQHRSCLEFLASGEPFPIRMYDGTPDQPINARTANFHEVLSEWPRVPMVHRYPNLAPIRNNYVYLVNCAMLPRECSACCTYLFRKFIIVEWCSPKMLLPCKPLVHYEINV